MDHIKQLQISFGETYNWRIYSSAYEGIDAFGNLIANGSYYYQKGNYTVGTIGVVYCPNTANHPTQADDWISNITSQITVSYEEIGIDISSYTTSGAGGVSGAEGEGYRGLYTTGSGKTYVEYLQYEGPWKNNYFYGGTMQNSGCSITSVAVILSGYGIDVNPEDIRAKYPAGVNLQDLIKSYGLKCETVNARYVTNDKLLNHLRNGNSVIINAGGYWTSSTGHYFPVLEANNSNQGYVSNVGSSTKTGWYSITKILESNKKVLFISQ